MEKGLTVVHEVSLPPLTRPPLVSLKLSLAFVGGDSQPGNDTKSEPPLLKRGLVLAGEGGLWRAVVGGVGHTGNGRRPVTGAWDTKG